jgi:ribosome-binding protein aMBF1 (putative translation factor)
MVQRCVRCDIREDEVRLFDAIYEGRMNSICERCSIIENIPIIKKPDASQLKESEQSTGVYDRMKRLSGIKDEKQEEIYFREDKLNELENKPELELPQKKQLNLIDYFHWEIMKNRRRKGLSQEKLAEVLGESPIVIEMIEKGKLPENAETLINKLEQFFQIKLRKITETEKFLEQQEKGPILLDEQGNELEIIPEEEIEIDIREDEEEPEEELEGIEVDIKQEPEEIETSLREDTSEKPLGVSDEEPEEQLDVLDEKMEFDITKANLSKIKISDLKEIHRKKIAATRQEQLEEQKKIEERQRLIEARKEELRLRREKESETIDQYLGGTELIRGDSKKPENIENSENIEEFDEELI